MPSAYAAYTVRRLKSFINKAESQWLTVYDSMTGPTTVLEGDEYRRLALRFGSRNKIYAYFRRHWSAALSAAMICNMRPRPYKGRLYVIVADPGPVPYRVVRLTIVGETAAEIRVSAVLSGSEEGNKTIRYTLSKAGGKLTIVSRSDRPNDYRYVRCTG